MMGLLDYRIYRYRLFSCSCPLGNLCKSMRAATVAVDTSVEFLLFTLSKNQIMVHSQMSILLKEVEFFILFKCHPFTKVIFLNHYVSRYREKLTSRP